MKRGRNGLNIRDWKGGRMQRVGMGALDSDAERATPQVTETLPLAFQSGLESIPIGSTVLLAAQPEDVPAAIVQVEEYGMRVVKRMSSQVAAVVCMPRRQMLSSEVLQKVVKHEAKGVPVIDFNIGTVNDTCSSTSSSSSSSNSTSSSSGSSNRTQTSTSVSSPTASSPKRSLKRKASEQQGADPQEKRLALWRKTCSSSTRDRIDRALHQRLYLIKQESVTSSVGSGPARRFTVLGSTGNVYTVIIDGLVSCDCPDAEKGNLCKHQLFVMLRVLRVPASSPLVYQKALLASEREELFASARRPERASIASTSVRKAFVQATSPNKKKEKTQEHRGSQDDDCPICFEALGEEKLETCQSCNNAVHEDCFKKWAKAQGPNVTCPFCRAAWVAPKAGKCQVCAEGYLNFGAVAGLPQHRDTSSYSSWYVDDDDEEDY